MSSAVNKKDFLLEIGTEEVPAASVVIGMDQLKQKAEAMFAKCRLGFEEIKTYGAPRRLALYIKGLDDRQKNAVYEVRGPAKKTAFTEDGKPAPAAVGFAKSQGVDVESLTVREHEGGEYVFAVKEEAGRETAAILAEFLPDLILSLSFPKSMRWGDGDIRFVRPIRWIVSLFGSDVVPFQLDGIKSGRESMGHRLVANHPVVIDRPSGYLAGLEKNMVVADQDKRAALIEDGIQDVVKSVGGYALVSERIFQEVLQLVEYPHAILGGFSSEYVALPREVPITAMQSHQRYFPVEDENGKLLPNFIVINNGNPGFTDLIRKGHERVIKARLADAKFFFEADSAKPLETYNEKLKGVTFQVKLGTVYQKTERVTKIAEEVALKLAFTQAEIDYAVRAAYLCKADLVTEMVGEFPDLQGEIGKEYAKTSGEPEQVSTAIFEHYLPRHSSDILPKTETGQVVSIADKLDSVCGILSAGLVPSGSEDPYALRRQAQGIVSVVLQNELDLSMKTLIFLALGLYREQGVEFDISTVADLAEEFIRSRLRAYLLGQGLPLDAVEAVDSIELDDMVDIKRRAEAVADKLDSEEMTDLLFAVTRCKNLARSGLTVEVDTGLLREHEEKELHQYLIRVERELSRIDHDYTAAIDVLAGLREPVNRFFDNVLVMAEDEAVKNNRIALLNFSMDLFRRVADFTKISSPAS